MKLKTLRKWAWHAFLIGGWTIILVGYPLLVYGVATTGQGKTRFVIASVGLVIMLAWFLRDWRKNLVKVWSME